MLVENDVSARKHDSDSCNPGLITESGEGRDERGDQSTTVQDARIIDYAYFRVQIDSRCIVSGEKLLMKNVLKGTMVFQVC